jgi:hypothetical protein
MSLYRALIFFSMATNNADTDISNITCGGSGSMGHYEIDADTYANDWQVDYLKVDYCGPTPGV